MSAEEFLETVDQGLDVRLQQPDGEDLAVLVRRLRGLFGKLVSKGKISLEMGRALMQSSRAMTMNRKEASDE